VGHSESVEALTALLAEARASLEALSLAAMRSFSPESRLALTNASARCYEAHLVSRSSWIDELEQRNRVHRSHRKEQFDAWRHYILCFHDTTFECVARDYETRMTTSKTPAEAIGRALEETR